MSEIFEIYVPKSTQWQPNVAATFTNALYEHVTSTLSLSIIASHGQLRWVMMTGEDETSLELETLQKLVVSYYPNAVVELAELDGFPQIPYERRFAAFSRSESDFYETFTTVHHFKTRDPLVMVAQAMSQLEPDEVLIYSLDISEINRYTEAQLFEFLTVSAHEAGHRSQIGLPMGGSANFVAGWIAGSLIRKPIENAMLKRKKLWRHNESDLERYRNKLSQKVAVVAVSLILDSPSKERLASLASVIGAVKNTTGDGLARISDGVDRMGSITTEEQENRFLPGVIVAQWFEAEQQRKNPKKLNPVCPRDMVFFMTPDELAALWHLPHEEFINTKTRWVDESLKPMPESLKSLDKGVVLGNNGDHAVRLPDEERTQHAVIIGKPGTGKSSLLHQLIHQDIAAGKGVCVIDPHGTLVRHILQSSIPTWRDNDVVVLDFANHEYPPPLNPLYRPTGVADEVAADMLRAVLMKIYPEFALKEMADTLQTVLLTLTAADQPIPLDVIRIFDEEAYRHQLVKKLDDYTLERYWAKFEGYSEAKQDEMARPVLWRMRPFYGNKALRVIACHPKPLNLRDLISQDKIILVSLAADEAKMPLDQRMFLGAALVSQLQMAVMSGAIKQPPYLLYIDEAQHFVTTGLDTMLSEARKQGLGLTLANQYLDQLAGDTLRAVEGTVSTLVAFEVGEPDAKAFATYLKPSFTVSDLVALGKYRAAVSLRYQNQRQPAFTLETLPPPRLDNEQVGASRESDLRQKSVENYTPMTYIQVQDELRKRYGPSQTPPTGTSPNDGGDDYFEPK